MISEEQRTQSIHRLSLRIFQELDISHPSEAIVYGLKRILRGAALPGLLGEIDSERKLVEQMVKAAHGFRDERNALKEEVETVCSDRERLGREYGDVVRERDALKEELENAGHVQDELREVCERLEAEVERLRKPCMHLCAPCKARERGGLS